jgi:hypothetical protein
MGSDGLEAPETEEERSVSKRSITNSVTLRVASATLFYGLYLGAVVRLFGRILPSNGACDYGRADCTLPGKYK